MVYKQWFVGNLEQTCKKSRALPVIDEIFFGSLKFSNIAAILLVQFTVCKVYSVKLQYRRFEKIT